MKAALIVFPHQLFDDHPGLRRDVQVFLVEDQLFFDDYKYHVPFHKNKLILHRATMNRYYRKLTSRGYHVTYIPFEKSQDMIYLYRELLKNEIEEIIYCDLSDFELERRIRKECDRYEIRIKELPSPMFLNSKERVFSLFNDNERLTMAQFYIAQRKHFHLLTQKNKPLGGKWSFDTVNNKKIPQKLKIPRIIYTSENAYVGEAEEYISVNFPQNPCGKVPFFYPITSTDINKWLEDFFKKRFLHFGEYNESADVENSFLFHPVISYALNIGLITPAAIIDMALSAAKEFIIPIHSLEVFIRQIAGWREYIRAIYFVRGVEERTRNYWGFNRHMPQKFYDGTLGIEPIDSLIRRVNDLCYLNYVERLMFIGNFMLLCEIHPDEVYKWFMAKFIDAYDWVEVPNVYGLSQFADGGILSAKPSICPSSQILKISSFKKGPWCEIWDGLYTRFIYKYGKIFLNISKKTAMDDYFEKKEMSKTNKQTEAAENFLSKL